MDTAGMRLSVIIPVLNEAKSLPHTLDALGDLRAQGHEIIIVDGGSTDGSRPLGSLRADRVLETPAGRAMQMNVGAGVACGEVLVFLHADTILPANAAIIIGQALQPEHQVWGRFRARLSGRQAAFRMIETLMNLRTCLTGIVTGDHAMFVRREAFERIGGFPELPLMEDIAISKRLRALAKPVCLKAAVLTSSRRWQQHGIVRTMLGMMCLRLGYFLGVDPRYLARYYRAERDTAKS